MKKNLILIILLLAFAFNAQAVVINEIAWMGTDEQWQNEWIELYNEIDSDVSLDGWTLKAEDDSLFIKLKGIIKSKSYFLLERTDDTTVPDIKADQIYKGSLNNNGVKLILLNHNDIVEEIDCVLGWFAGNNETKKTMERIIPDFNGCDPLNWKNSAEKGGTPKAQNSEEKEILEKQITSVPQNINYSGFSSALIPGMTISLLSSMLSMGFVLKIKQKKNNIKV
ncbi:lamin tail domain-containing protein [Patescibacteria group bacterium]|nr:lamin tail domain-containing protein [Patescibacteria group bacterium]MBU4078259.1 lamin tail domain-containing protein [Patescibacteria group bacterium]